MRSLLLAGAAGAAAQTIKMGWMTDGSCPDGRGQFCGPRGPDGPWQGIRLSPVGFPGEAFLPTGYWGSQVLTVATGANYDPEKSKNANKTRQFNNVALSDPWDSIASGGDGAFGREYYELLSLGDADHVEVNTSIVAMQRWQVDQMGGNYTSQFSVLGLAPYLAPDGPGTSDKIPPGILEQCKSQKKIESESYGLHIGSVPLGQPGSLVLGGYEQNRALGDVAVFELGGAGIPKAFLLDVTLGVEAGRSPFEDEDALGSVWQGLGRNDRANEATKKAGGVKGSALFTLNPAKPYMYLPPGNCEALAKHLPVTWRESVRLYTWDTEDPRYERIVSSPAYVGFVVADRTASNITVKIPFRLLNLTLEEPLVEKPTPYFPCQPGSLEVDTYMLGRAFLQGAFMGVNYEKSLMYLAQAPGPDMEQSVMKTHKEDDETIETRPADSFEKTWRSSWKVIEDEKENGEEGGGGSSDNGNNPDESSSSGPSAGIIAGCVVGALCAIATVVLVVLFLRRRRRRRRRLSFSNNTTIVVHDADDKNEKDYGLPEAPGGDLRHEMHAPKQTLEAPGRELAHELHAPKKTFEAPGVEMYHELDSTPLARELPALTSYDRRRY